MLPSSSPPTTIPLPSAGAGAGTGALSPSVLIIVAIISAVILISAAIHLILRYLARRRRHSSIPLRSPSISSSASSDSFRLGGSMIVADTEQKTLIDSLPIFTLSSAVSVAPRCSADCAVCLSRFEPDEQLRLLPACRHAFHSSCIDTWLHSTPSCPLCRASVHLPPAEPNPSAPAAGALAQSESFRVEIGSVSRRTEEVAAAEAATEGRAYSLGSSFEYVVEEEIEAVVAAVATHVHRASAEGKEDFAAAAPPDETVAADAGGCGRSWLRDYVDRIASSASSSFSSMRWRSRNEPGGSRGSWDLEGAEDYYSLYRWLVGT